MNPLPRGVLASRMACASILALCSVGRGEFNCTAMNGLQVDIVSGFEVVMTNGGEWEPHRVVDVKAGIYGRHSCLFLRIYVAIPAMAEKAKRK